MLVILCLKTWLEIVSTVAMLAVANIQGVNQAQGIYQTSKGYISSQGMYRIYRTGGAFEVWLQWEISIGYYTPASSALGLGECITDIA